VRRNLSPATVFSDLARFNLTKRQDGNPLDDILPIAGKALRSRGQRELHTPAMFAENISLQREGEDEMSYLWTAIIGFVAGLIARALHPGDDKLGFIMTAVLGIAGAFIANFVGQAVGWYQPGEQAGLIASVIGAIVILVIYSLIKKRRGA
jgi:uncharacterized membrane protein YeaQ/YmgE (transglycosylase-associated protein family)